MKLPRALFVSLMVLPLVSGGGAQTRAQENRAQENRAQEKRAPENLAQAPAPNALPARSVPQRQSQPRQSQPRQSQPQPRQAQPNTAPARGVRHLPIIFFIAKGGPDACGPGCDTWIGAEGTFDPEAPKRLIEFLNVRGRQRLPIFFHSPGGELQPSITIGNLLREKRMIAGIGQTLPEGCREAARADNACREVMRSGRELTARLKVASGACASACAYALIGASTRLIGPGAKFGIHANRVIPRSDRAEDVRRVGPAARQAAELQSYDLLRHYVTVAGVDPALIDLATRTPHDRVHWLTREELERFGLVYGDSFETRWLRHARPDGSTFIIKSLTEVLPSQEHRTTNIAINCIPNSRATMMLRRELGVGQNSPQPVVRLSSGDSFVMVFSHGNRSPGSTEVRVQPVAADALARVAASDTLVLREEGAREFRLSTKGLSEALSATERCGGRA